jgi:SagB-type dehydrogenase family enzyme
MKEPTEEVFEYHKRSKHHFDRYARGPGYLDWESQPDPFRRYEGATLRKLDRIPPSEEPSYEDAFVKGRIPPAPLNLKTLSRLLFDSLALSAWKRAGRETWSLRVNPSSGNLHPTEGYVICGPLPELDDAPLVCHYAPKEHALELRTRLPGHLWDGLSAGFPGETVFIGLSSIHWREAWKYGERAYRYCMLDVGHALGAVRIAAAGLGWDAKLLDDLSAEQVGWLLGLKGGAEAERERPDCLLAIYPAQARDIRPQSIDPDIIRAVGELFWSGKPNLLSSSHVAWPAIELVSEACEKPQGCSPRPDFWSSGSLMEPEAQRKGSLPLRRIIHQRRSAVAMDGVSSMSGEAFYHMLQKTLAGPGGIPFDALPWEPCVHLALFVHRVVGMAQGLYFLIRDECRKGDLKAVMSDRFVWQKPEGCPESLSLYLLAPGNVMKPSMQIACFQEIASGGCFSAGMIAEFERPLKQYGAWFYPRLYWECGMIGQVLYLAAEAAGLRATGIGCYFDDPMHDLLGLKDMRYQDLYHFTVGKPVEDPRLTTLPAYYHLKPI